MTSKLSFCSGALLAALGAVTGGCSFPKGPPMFKLAAEINSTLYWRPSTISPGDTLSVSFRNRTEWDQSVNVHLDGTASFLAIPTMMVAGMSLDEIDEVLTKAYATLVPDPDVSIGLKVEAPRTFAIIGEVGAPGQFALPPERRLTLVEALGLAEGPSKRTAWLGNTQLIRWVPERGRLESFVFDARQKHWLEGEPVFLQPFDVLYVPNTNVDKVAIWVDNYIRRMIPFPYLIPGTF